MIPERSTEKIIGANEDGIVTSPTLLALQRLPVNPVVRASWTPAEEQRYRDMVAFREAADNFGAPSAEVTGSTETVANTRMALATK